MNNEDILPDPDVWHVYPVDDIKPHEVDGKPCECHPTVKVYAECILITHNSFDGREGVEFAREILEGDVKRDGWGQKKAK